MYRRSVPKRGRMLFTNFTLCRYQETRALKHSQTAPNTTCLKAVCACASSIPDINNLRVIRGCEKLTNLERHFAEKATSNFSKSAVTPSTLVHVQHICQSCIGHFPFFSQWNHHLTTRPRNQHAHHLLPPNPALLSK